MKTLQQKNGSEAEEIVRRHCPCMQCGMRQWRRLDQDREGVDIQCRTCGRFGQVRGLYRPRVAAIGCLPTIPGASHAVHDRNRRQGHRTDLYVVAWNRNKEFVVFGIMAEQQTENLFVKRPILTGKRAGYELCDVVPSVLGQSAVRVLASRTLEKRAAKPRWNHQVAAPGGSISLSGSLQDGHSAARAANVAWLIEAAPADIGFNQLPVRIDNDSCEPAMVFRNPPADETRVPTIHELLRGSPFYLDDLRSDASAFAKQVIATLDADDASIHDLFMAVAALRIDPKLREYETAAHQFQIQARQPGQHALTQHATRCHLYAALLGDENSVRAVAAYTVAWSWKPTGPIDDERFRARAAVAWLLALTGKRPLPPRWTAESATMFLAVDQQPSGVGRQMFEQMLANRSAWLKLQTETAMLAARTDIGG